MERGDTMYRIAIATLNVASLVAYMSAYLVSSDSIQYLTTPYTWRTTMIPKADSWNTTDPIALQAAVSDKFGCTAGLTYDVTTSWSKENSSPACKCLAATMKNFTTTPSTDEDKVRAVVRCFMGFATTDVERSYSWNQSFWVTNPAVVVGTWNVLACTSSLSHLGMGLTMSFVAGLLSTATIFAFAAPLAGTTYILAPIFEAIIFFLLAAAVYYATNWPNSPPESIATLRRDWISWILYTFALPLAFCVYNSQRFVRDIYANVLFTLVGMSVSMSCAATSLYLKTLRDDVKNNNTKINPNQNDVNSSNVPEIATASNILILAASLLLHFPSFDPLTFAIDSTFGGNSGGFSTFRASGPAVLLLCLVVPLTTFVGVKLWWEPRNACEAVEIASRLILTISMAVDLAWLNEARQPVHPM